MSVQISPAEQEQILQTIEMFEVITQSNPDDCQSLEILKDAYNKIGRIEDSQVLSRRLADRYRETGQFSSAVLEYESLLQQHPEDQEIADILADLESKMHSGIAPGTANEDGIELDFGAFTGDHLVVTKETRLDFGGLGAVPMPESDGNDQLAKFLLQYKLASEEAVATATERVQKTNKSLKQDQLAASLINELVGMKAVELDTILCGILDRTKFAYIPLEYYEVDRQIVKLIPETLTMGRLIVPFDLVSRTVMIAMANPFDSLGKDAVQQLLDYNIQWHLASPRAIMKALTEVYRLNEKGR